MLELYDDREQTFTCGVKIEGSQYSNAIPRLVVSSKGKNIFFEGVLKGDVCQITIPPMSDIEDCGKVSLELVIDNALMIPWNSTYKVISSFQTEAIDPKIYGKSLVKAKRQQAQKKEFKITDKLIVESKKPRDNFLKQKISRSTKFLVEDLLTIYNTLSVKQKKLVTEDALRYNPSKKTLEWARQVFKKSTSLTAQICMYEVEQYLQKQQKPEVDKPSRSAVTKDTPQKKSEGYKQKKSNTTDISKPDTRIMSQRLKKKKKKKTEIISTYRKLMM